MMRNQFVSPPGSRLEKITDVERAEAGRGHAGGAEDRTGDQHGAAARYAELGREWVEPTAPALGRMKALNAEGSLRAKTHKKDTAIQGTTGIATEAKAG